MTNLLDSITKIFKNNKVDSGKELNIQIIINNLELINKDDNVIGQRALNEIRKFSNEHPTVKLNIVDTLELINKIENGGFQKSQPELKDFYSMPIKSKPRRSLLSNQAKFAPLPESNLSSSFSKFKRPESPLGSYETNSRLLNSPFKSSENLSTPLSPFDSDVGRMHRTSSLRSMKMDSTHSLNNNFEQANGYITIRSPSLDINKLNFDDEILNADEHKKIRKATSFLNQKLEQTEDSLSEVVNESNNKIELLEQNNKLLKHQIYTKQKEIHEQQLFINKQQDQINNLEREQIDINQSLNQFKKLYYQSKKQNEEISEKYEKENQTKKSKIEELELTLKEMKQNNLEHKAMILRVSAMKKKIISLEKEVQIAQSVAKNYDHVVQENFQMKTTIENLQKSLDETNNNQHNNLLDHVILTPKGEISNPLELPMDININSPCININNNNEKNNTKQLRELERENKYLKRNIEKTWNQWDSVKMGFSKIPGLQSLKDQSFTLTELLNKMERHRPNKAFPKFQRASIQHVIIDDRPFLSPTELIEMSKSLTQEAEMNRDFNIQLDNNNTDLTSNQNNKGSTNILDEEYQDKKDELSITISGTKDTLEQDDPNVLATSHSSTNSFHSLSSQTEQSNSENKQVYMSPENSSTTSTLSDTLETTTLKGIPNMIGNNSNNQLAPLPRPISINQVNNASIRNRRNKNRNSRVIKKISFNDLIQGEDLINAPILNSDVLLSPTQNDNNNNNNNNYNQKNGNEILESEYHSNQLKIGDLYTSNILKRSQSTPLSKTELEKQNKDNSTSQVFTMVLYYVFAYFLTFISSKSNNHHQQNINEKEMDNKNHTHINRIHRIQVAPSIKNELTNLNRQESISIFKFWLQTLMIGGSNVKSN